MNILVIGNGFDLAHGLPTKYTDFLKFLKAVSYQVFCESVEPDVTAGNDLNLDIESTISSYQIRGSSSLERMYKDLIEYNVWIDYFLQNPMYQKENWIDFESEISRVIQSIDSDMKKFNATESTIVRYNVDFFLVNYFLDNVESRELTRNIEALELCKNMPYDKHSKFLEEYIRKHPVEPLKDKITYKELIMRLERDLNRLIRALEIYLTDFVETMEITKISDDIKNLDIDHVLSFNYTNTFEKLYGQKRNIEYDYIHGKADINNTIIRNNMVLGIDEYLDNDRKNKDIGFIAFKKYYQRIHKQTGCKYKEWVDEIETEYEEYQKYQKDVYIQIVESIKDGSLTQYPYQKEKYSEQLQEECPQHNLYIFGHSLDVTDKDILRDLILHDNVHTTIFYYEENNDNGRTDLGKKIANLVKVIGQDELIKRTGGNTRTIEFKLQQDMMYIEDNCIESM